MNAPSSKYDSFRDSALHFLCNAGWGNESDGDANDYGSHFTRITLEGSDVHIHNTEFTSLIEQWANYEVADVGGIEFRASLIGHFIVSEGSQGFVTVRSFPTEHAAKARFAAFAEHYASWSDDAGDN